MVLKAEVGAVFGRRRGEADEAGKAGERIVEARLEGKSSRSIMVDDGVGQTKIRREGRLGFGAMKMPSVPTPSCD